MSPELEPRRQGTPGGPSDLFLVVAALVLLMPTAVAVWLVTAWWLRRQYASRWWPLLVALVLAPLLLLVGAPRAALGGILAAADAFQVPQWTLLPIVYASTVFLARVAWSTSALAFPIGLVAAAAIAGPRVELPGAPSPALRRRAARSEQREIRRVEKLSNQGNNITLKIPNLALGVVAGPGDLPPGWVQGQHLVLPERAANLPRLVVGRPGQGKSVYLCREVHLAGLDHRQAVVVDCKGEPGFADQVEAAYRVGFPDATVHRWPDEPLNGWTGGPAAVANRLLSVWTFDAASLWYREVVDMALTLALHAPGEEVTGSRDVLRRVQPDTLAQLWHDHPDEAGLVRSLQSKNKLDDVSIRLGNLLSALGGLLDGKRAIGQADLTILSLPTMGKEHQAASMLRVVLSDLAHYVSSRKAPRRRLLTVVDEFSAVPGGREHAIHLAERGRSAAAATVLAVQSSRGLGDDDDADRLIGAGGAVVLFGTAEPERILKLAGTVQTARSSVTLGEHYSTTTSEATEYRVDANDVRALPPGYAYVLASGRAQRIKVLRPPGGEQPCATAPAVAVDEREVPPPVQSRQGRSLRSRPFGQTLDPPGRSSVPRKRPPAPGGGNPPDDRDNREESP